MFDRWFSMPVIVGALLVSACSDDVRPVGSNSNDTNDTPYDVGDISGVWDISGSVSETGEAVTGTLTINRDVFSLELGKVVVHYSWAEPDTLGFSASGRDEVNGVPEPVRGYGVTRVAAPAVDLGVIPLDIGGSWQMSDGGPLECEAEVGESEASGSCAETYTTPFSFEHVSLGAFLTTRLEKNPSIFGELGGTWNLAMGSGRGPGACTAALRDKTIIATCLGSPERLAGSFTFTLEEGFGSGSSDEGLEVSAVRR